MTEQGLEPRSSDNNSRTISITLQSVPQLRPGKLNVSDGWKLLRSHLNERLKGSLSRLFVRLFSRMKLLDHWFSTISVPKYLYLSIGISINTSGSP